MLYTGLFLAASLNYAPAEEGISTAALKLARWSVPMTWKALPSGLGDEEGEGETGFGLYAKARTDWGEYFHLSTEPLPEQIASDITLIRGSVAPQATLEYHASLVALYGEAGVTFAASSGLRDFGRQTAAADGSGGDGGFIGVVGLRNRPLERFEWHIGGGSYMSFGETDYPDDNGSSSGDGPIYELGASYDLSDRWAMAPDLAGHGLRTTISAPTLPPTSPPGHPVFFLITGENSTCHTTSLNAMRTQLPTGSLQKTLCHLIAVGGHRVFKASSETANAKRQPANWPIALP